MPDFKKNRNPILMAGTKGGPIHSNYSPLKDDKKSELKYPDVIPTASDTLGAFAYQNYPSLRHHKEGGPKIKAAHDKLKGHIVTREEMEKASETYMKELKKK